MGQRQEAWSRPECVLRLKTPRVHAGARRPNVSFCIAAAELGALVRWAQQESSKTRPLGAGARGAISHVPDLSPLLAMDVVDVAAARVWRLQDPEEMNVAAAAACEEAGDGKQRHGPVSRL